MGLVFAFTCFPVRCRHSSSRQPKYQSDKTLSYAKLGLLHLTFTATQWTKNETLVFANLHEKLLRAQLQLLVLKYSAEPPAAMTTATVSPSEGSSIAVKAAWAEMNLTYCCEMAQRGGYHTIL